MGHCGTYPLDFQLFNFSGHFRAAQTLTFDISTCYRPINLQVALQVAMRARHLIRPIGLTESSTVENWQTPALFFRHN